MEGLTINFRLGNIPFRNVDDLEEKDKKTLEQSYLQWEKELRVSSATHFLQEELGDISSNTLKVIVDSIKESPTSNG